MARRKKPSRAETEPRQENGIVLSDTVLDMVADLLMDPALEDDREAKLERKRRAA